MEHTAPRRPKAVQRTPRKPGKPVWTFETKESGLCEVVLKGGGRSLSLCLYPAELDALKKACAYDIWAEEKG